MADRRMYTAQAALCSEDKSRDVTEQQMLSLIDTIQPKDENDNSIVPGEKCAEKWRMCYRDRTSHGFYVPLHLHNKNKKRKPGTVEEYNRAILFTTMNNQINKAIKYFREMEQRLIKPDNYTYTIIINAYSKQSDMVRAIKWFKRMKTNGSEPDAYTYTSLIDGYMRIADIDKAESVFRSMMMNNVHPTLVTYNILMHHSVTQLDIKTAMSFWENLLQAGLKPDVYTFAILMHGLGEEGRVDEAWRLYNTMKEENVDINTHIATTLMSMHVKHRDNEHTIQLYRQFFEAPGNNALVPTSHTRNILLNAVISNTDEDKIEKYYEQFKDSLLPHGKAITSPLFSGQSSVYTYTLFMRAFLRHNSISMVSQVYQDMIARQVKPTVVTYAVLMLAHSFVPDPYSCVHILNEMKHAKLEVNAVLYTIVMRAWAKLGRWDQVQETYETMKGDNIQPTKLTLEVLRWGRNRGHTYLVQ
ncbi:hypothetical protein F4703DRAFT_1899048 [Phycomyces blakesleeanus]